MQSTKNGTMASWHEPQLKIFIAPRGDEINGFPFVKW